MCVNRLSYIDWYLLVSFEVACLVCPSGSGHSDPGRRCLVETMDHVLCEDDCLGLYTSSKPASLFMRNRLRSTATLLPRFKDKSSAACKSY